MQQWRQHGHRKHEASDGTVPCSDGKWESFAEPRAKFGMLSHSDYKKEYMACDSISQGCRRRLPGHQGRCIGLSFESHMNDGNASLFFFSPIPHLCPTYPPLCRSISTLFPFALRILPPHTQMASRNTLCCCCIPLRNGLFFISILMLVAAGSDIWRLVAFRSKDQHNILVHSTLLSLSVQTNHPLTHFFFLYFIDLLRAG